MNVIKKLTWMLMKFMFSFKFAGNIEDSRRSKVLLVR
jgi:hypothetical protein